MAGEAQTQTQPANAWGITLAEHDLALERSRDPKTSPDDAADYWQLVRYFRGQVFYRDGAARGARLVRGMARL